MSDVFGTGEIRRRVLAGWEAGAARFREDANAEEDFGRGGYRGRVVVELAQNAADAAVRAGVPGHVVFSLAGDVLTADNNGSALDAAGVESLSTLRVSTKRGTGAVGRFGVGFSAVVAVSEEPSITSGGAAVAWSAERTRAEVAGIAALAGELEARKGQVPLLRLPYEGVPGIVPEGFTTRVTLPLASAEAVRAVEEQLEAVGAALLLALPGLSSLTVTTANGTRTLASEWAGDGDVTITETAVTLGGDGSGVGTEVTVWRTVEAHGEIAAELLADRPVEERERPFWQVRWAVRDDFTWGERVVHAPTPSAEPLDLPALLIAGFPMGTDRRHVAEGPLTGFLVDRAAEAYLDLLRRFDGPELLALVPGPVAAGTVDAALRHVITGLLPGAAVLPFEGGRVRGRDAAVVDGPPGLAEIVGEVVDGVLPERWPVRNPGLRALGVRRIGIADAVDALAGVRRDAAWWRGTYDVLATGDLGELGALPVPLVDGRVVRGPRGVLLGRDLPSGLDVLGLRIADPEADHPLLTRLGAVEAGPRQVLSDPAVRIAVENSFEDSGEIADAILRLAEGLDALEPWLSDLALTGRDGEPYAAGELLFADSPLVEIMGPDSPFGIVSDELVERYGRAALEAVGVLWTFAVLRAEDPDLDELDLDGVDAWDLPQGHLPELAAVRDLELVRDWPAALRLLAAPPLREVVLEPLRMLDGTTVPSYTSWWLTAHDVLGGPRRAPNADPILEGLYDLAPEGLDPEFARALGVRRFLDDLPPDELLDRLADPARTVTRTQLRELWTWLAGASDLAPPDSVRAVVGESMEIVPADDAIIVDAPYTLPLLITQPLVLLPHTEAEALSDLLDLPLATDELAGEITSEGTVRPVPQTVLDLFPEAPETYFHHAPLVVDGHEVSWWYDGAPHASTPQGLARAMAWELGRWSDRHLLSAILADPGSAAVDLAEFDLA
ncbi:sacsin N-terminal ATP-binding-like domain-containing protein [Actinocorallia longicatena]|uniref:Molecular chaperone Hsp90 n=1 Tax=Actinocorallia longicatena TaxID=111803 RepID=A0ABP6Q3G9_9ACTN